MTALLLGSISSVADTSELQRKAFNDAFAAHGLDWRWEGEDYRSMLTGNGGAARVAEYAKTRGENVDAQAVHDTKSKLFQESLTTAAPAARPGVVEAVTTAKQAGWQVGLVTTTSRANIAALLEALSPELGADQFDLIVDSASVDQSKPDPAAYLFALERLGVGPHDCVAVEDNVGGVEAAAAAGVPCVAFPNENTGGHDFSAARIRVDRLQFEELQGLTQ